MNALVPPRVSPEFIHQVEKWALVHGVPVDDRAPAILEEIEKLNPAPGESAAELRARQLASIAAASRRAAGAVPACVVPAVMSLTGDAVCSLFVASSGRSVIACRNGKSSKRTTLSAMESEPMSAPLLLEGVKVLTLEQVHALPWGTAFLADLGAQVIRIESVEHLQDRKAGPFVNGKPGPEWWNEGANLAYFGTRNKQSLCLQVTTPAGKEVFLKLVKNCDIVTDNFRPGTMRRYGFDHESLAQINPRIITLEQHGLRPHRPVAQRRVARAHRGLGVRHVLPHRLRGRPFACGRATTTWTTPPATTWPMRSCSRCIAAREPAKACASTLTMQETGVSCIGPAILEAQRGITRPRLGCCASLESAAQHLSVRGQGSLDRHRGIQRRRVDRVEAGHGRSCVGAGCTLRLGARPLAESPRARPKDRGVDRAAGRQGAGAARCRRRAFAPAPS